MSRGTPQLPEVPPEIVAYGAAYQCPDCVAEKALAYIDGLWHLDVRHHDTCPVYRSMQRKEHTA
jgi:hypothetical protein